jgi:dipicolinate synthase subunit A
VSNALITAEGALLLALSRREETLWGSRVLLTGMGRIAKVLLRQLVALGARVTVAARRPEDRQWARIGGAEAVDFAQLPDLVGTLI